MPLCSVSLDTLHVAHTPLNFQVDSCPLPKHRLTILNEIARNTSPIRARFLFTSPSRYPPEFSLKGYYSENHLTLLPSYTEEYVYYFALITIRRGFLVYFRPKPGCKK